MINLVKPENWQTVDGLSLQQNAMEVVRSSQNTLVIAGPGAGKTELLAQRACFLLQTNTCKYPRKILAISFKKDAAKVIANRVEQRCGKELSQRFVSKTYDSFAKSMLLDPFRLAIPRTYRPNNYDVLTKKDEYQSIDDIFKAVENTYIYTTTKDVRIKSLTDLPLPIEDDGEKRYEIAKQVWRIMLRKNPSWLTFPMISRLAEYIIRVNPQIKDFLLKTFSYVFLDEFQDTTRIQYDLVNACFKESNTILTAVGDNKQRIMVWAGAVKSIFEEFQSDYHISSPYRLMLNYRSTPKIVALQKFLVNKLMPEKEELILKDNWEKEDGEIQLWRFNDYQKEAVKVAEAISGWINNDQISPQHICIIVKQLPDKYGTAIIQELQNLNIKARDENKYQDLLTEEFVLLLLDMILISVNRESPNEYNNIINLIKKIKGIYEDEYILKEEKILFSFLSKLKQQLTEVSSKESLKKVLAQIIKYFDYQSIIAVFPQYGNKNYTKELFNSALDLLYNEYLDIKCWTKAVRSLKGEYSVPIMTIHKSKGLEYEIVIFLGLEDSAFWNFLKQSEEDICAFFVAMSRAKQRLIFTFSGIRIGRYNRDESQSNENIKSLYEVLEQSELVEEIDFIRN